MDSNQSSLWYAVRIDGKVVVCPSSQHYPQHNHNNPYKD